MDTATKGYWLCPCGCMMSARTERCLKCGRPRPAPEPDAQHPTCKEFAYAMGHDQAKTMGIPLTDQPLKEFIAERDERRRRWKGGAPVALKAEEKGSDEMLLAAAERILALTREAGTR